MGGANSRAWWRALADVGRMRSGVYLVDAEGRERPVEPEVLAVIRVPSGDEWIEIVIRRTR